jgi:hypothetical protein
MLILFAQLVWGQSPAKIVTAKIVADTTAIEKVNVLNLRNAKRGFQQKRYSKDDASRR